MQDATPQPRIYKYPRRFCLRSFYERTSRREERPYEMQREEKQQMHLARRNCRAERNLHLKFPGDTQPSEEFEERRRTRELFKKALALFSTKALDSSFHDFDPGYRQKRYLSRFKTRCIGNFPRIEMLLIDYETNPTHLAMLKFLRRLKKNCNRTR